MKNLEELKSKHQEFKKLLVDTVEYINSEDFFNLTSSEKNFVNQFRVGVEVTTNALTNLSFGDILSYDYGGSMIFPVLLSSIMSPGAWGKTPSSEAMDILKVIAHRSMSKEQAAQYLNMSTSRFGDYVRMGKLPKGRKVVGHKELRWYEDELILCKKRGQN